MTKTQQQIYIAEKFVDDVLEGLTRIIRERKLLRRAAEMANHDLQTQNLDYLEAVLGYTSPAECDTTPDD